MEQKYSVLMSVYKEEKPQHLQEAIDSMLKQTILPAEFVLIKDGKLPKELELIIEKYEKQSKIPFLVFQNPKNLGLGKSLASGVEKCNFEYIARMDSDDIAVSNRCEKEIQILNENTKIDAVGSIVAEFEKSIKQITGYRLLPEKNEKICEFAKKRNPCAHSSMMLRKSKVLEVGNYRDYLYFEDYDLWIRMLKNGCQFYNLQEVLVYMRTEENFYQRRGRIILFKTNVEI